MAEDRIAAAAEALAAAWQGGARIALPSAVVAPADLDEAVRIQDALHERLGLECVGWKIGMSSKAALAASGLPAPFTGRLYRPRQFASPARFAADAFTHPVLEAEIAFRVAQPLPPRAAEYGEVEVLRAVETAILGIEVADNRYDATPPLPPLLLTADNGATGAYVVGPDVRGWRELDLAAVEANLEVNGGLAGASLRGDARCLPVPVLVWAANALSVRGIGLKAGDVVSTGTACAPVPCGPGTVAVARFAGLGDIEVKIG